MSAIIGSLLIIEWLYLTGCNAWPEGTYGLPMASKGCPVAEHFQWEKGSRTQMTEAGSHSSNPIHLAGIQPSDSSTVIQNFCMKTSYTGDSKHHFSPGRYCLLKKGDCPSGFKSGYIYWDDNAPLLWESELQNYSGSLPDGSYNSNTKVYYCCREDGSTNKPLRLPTAEPFYLFKKGDNCQQVEGMDYAEEWVQWADESSFNMNEVGGMYPRNVRSRYPGKYTKVYYCYYTPKPPNKTLKTVLTVIYALAGAVGGILAILVLLCLIQKICNHKQDPYTDTNLDNSHQEHMMHSMGGRATATTEVEPLVVFHSTNGHVKMTDSSDSSTVGSPDGDIKLPAYPGPPSLEPSPPYSLESSSCGATPPVITPPTAPPFDDANRPLSKPPTYEDVLREKRHEGSDED